MNQDWESAVQAAVSAYGKLDILLNNAGILIRKNIEETTEEDWDRIFSVNAKGVFLGTKAAIPAMRENGGGSIINISSTAGLVGQPERVGQLHGDQGSGAAVHQVHRHPARDERGSVATRFTQGRLRRT